MRLGPLSYKVKYVNLVSLLTSKTTRVLSGEGHTRTSSIVLAEAAAAAAVATKARQKMVKHFNVTRGFIFIISNCLVVVHQQRLRLQYALHVQAYLPPTGTA